MELEKTRAGLWQLTPSQPRLSLWIATVIFCFLSGAWWGVGLGNRSDGQTGILLAAQQPKISEGSASSASFNIGPVVSDRGSGFFELSQRVAVPEGELSLSGWAFDGKRESPVTRVWVVINNLAPLPVLSFHGKLERIDVVESFRGNEAYRFSGWEASFSTKGLRPGRYSFAVYTECEDGVLFPLPAGGGLSPTIVIPGQP